MKVHVLTFLLLFMPPLANALEVNVYTERQPVFLEQIFSDFTAETGIEVNVLYIDSGLVDRLQMESDASPADSVIFTDIGRLTDFAARGLAMPIGSAQVWKDVPKWLRDKDDLWTAYTRRVRMVYVTKGAVDRPATFEELEDKRWRGDICVRSLTHPYNIALVAALLAFHGEDATMHWLRGLRANLARNPQGNDRAQIIGVANGVCALGIANGYYYHKMLNSNDSNQREAALQVDYIAAELGGAGPHINISGVAIAKHAPNPDNARKLIEFMLRETSQRMFAEFNGEIPVRDFAWMTRKVPAATGGGVKVDLARIGKLRARASKLIELADLD